MLKTTIFDQSILIIQLNHEKKENPFSRKMTQELMSKLNNMGEDPSIKSAVLTGGLDRCFSVGGDFKDVSQLHEVEQIREYLLEIIDLYITILSFPKPLIMAIDHFAIGQGLQVALMGDYRIGTFRSSIAMPELKNGVACPLGAIILERMLGRAHMLRYVMDCGEIKSQRAMELGLLDELFEPQDLLIKAQEKALKFANYPSIPFVLTKKIQNQRFIDDLNMVRPHAAHAHIESFMAKSGEKHFKNILGKSSL